METITYLIGAGASYHSLPLIKTMNARMKAFKTFLEIQKDKENIKHKFADQLFKDLTELINIEANRTSIDAYARELSISSHGEAQIKLLRLKALLSSYIIFEQLTKPKDLVLFSDDFDYEIMPAIRVPLDLDLQTMIKTSIDKRYITFWGDYLTDKSETLPNNIKILSWNYDMQFESSYSNIKNCNLEYTQQNLQVFPSILNTIDIYKSCILKLNGTAGLIDNSASKSYTNLFDPREHELMDNLDYLIEFLEKNYNRAINKPLFYFAWETEHVVRETRQLARQIIEETTILVIIGYSFPTFNKTVDREIFANISKLKKIYYQVPKDEFDELVDKLDGINLNMRAITKSIHNLSTFYIPTEH